jgi:hypothetical protein
VFLLCAPECLTVCVVRLFACDRALLQLLVVCLQCCRVVVASCWLSSDVLQLSVLLLLHACTHFKEKKIPVTRMVVVTKK